MTTSNGGAAQSRVAEHVDAIVRDANDRGVHLLGETDWRNFSKYGDRAMPPAHGARVRLGMDSSRFVRELQILDQPASVGEPPERSREVRRFAVRRAAANFLGSMSQCRYEVRSEHVLVLAKR